MSAIFFYAMRYILLAVELVACGTLVFRKFDKKKHFVPRFIFSFAALIIIAFLLAVAFRYYLEAVHYDYESPLSMFLTCLFYLIVFISAAAVFFLCYSCDKFSLGFYSVSAFCVRHFIFTVYLFIVNFLFPQFNLFNHFYTSFPSFLIYLLIYALIGTAVFFIFLRKLSDVVYHKLGNGVIILFATTLFINVVINSVCEIYSKQHFVLYINGLVVQAVSMLLILAVQKLIIERLNLKNEKEIVNTILEQQEKQYKFSKANAELLSIKAHDLKHQVAVLRQGGAEADKLLDELENVTSAYDSVIKTDNSVINIILSEKWIFCKKHNINLSCTVNPTALDFMQNTDIYSLMGNILDNCIEAVMRVQDTQKRIISLRIDNKNGLTSISTNNYYDGKIDIKDGLPITSKSDKISHGFGMRSIVSIVKKYKGNMDIFTEDNIFVLNIVFNTF